MFNSVFYIPFFSVRKKKTEKDKKRQKKIRKGNKEKSHSVLNVIVAMVMKMADKMGLK